MPGRLEGPAAKRGASGSLSPMWDGPRLVELGNNWTVDNASVLFFWRGFSLASKTASSLFLSSLRLMGPFPDPDFDLRCRNDYGFVTAIPPQPRAASIELMRSSQVLLLFRHLECTLTLPGKLYEYMASGGHIIAVTGTEDELDVVLADYPNCQILRNPDEGAYRAAIERVFDLYRSGHLVARAPDAVASFSRQRASAVLSEVFDEVLRD